MRPRFALAVLLLSPAFALVPLTAQDSGTPLPDPTELMKRALANEKKLAAEQERYECRVTSEGAETDKNGKVKKSTVEVKERFYVNGMPIERTLSKNGKELSGDDARKEDERVMKRAVKYNDKTVAAKESAKQDQEALDIMKAMVLANGRRERADGRSVLFYDIVPNPHFQAKNLTQRFAQVMQGKISIDEESGEMIEMNVKSVQDVKIAGGVVASLHKGFWLHIHNQPQPDGVWLTDLAEGSGDARAVLFFHPYFRFKETTGDCHLYSTSANQVGQAKLSKP